MTVRYTWLATVIDDMFEAPVCGDGICETPQEYAGWTPTGNGEGRTFAPCIADCGFLDNDLQAYVRINFDDVQKLKSAFGANEKLRALDSYYGATTTAWGIADNEPVAGWNVCSRDKREDGFLDTVCVFDADVSSSWGRRSHADACLGL